MTDWSVYELEHIVWDVCDNNDDRIVPLFGAELDKQPEAQGESHGKGWHDTDSVLERNTVGRRSAARNAIQEDADAAFYYPLAVDVPEWQQPYAYSNPYPVSCTAGCMAFSTLASKSDHRSNDVFENHSIVTNSDGIALDDCDLGSVVAFDENNLHTSSLDIFPAKNDLDLVEIESKCKENDDILDYGWPGTPDIGNFEDFEKMFSDPTNSHEYIRNMDELPWLSSSSLVAGSEDQLKPRVQLSPSQSYSSSFGINSKERKISTLHDQREDEKCSSFIASAALPSSSQLYGPGNHMLECNLSCSCNQCMAVKCSSSPQQISSSIATSCMKSQRKTKSSLTGKVSAQASKNEYLSMARKPDPALKNPALTVEEKVHGAYLRKQQRLNNLAMSHAVNHNETQPMLVDQNSFANNLHKQEESSKICNIQDDICTASMWSQNISLSQASLRQLQDAINQMDVRTKLCIRDGLYRLAGSAQKRNNDDDAICDCEEGRKSGSVVCAIHSKKSPGFTEAETSTNAIDRSIAHLLFHGASDYSSEDALSFVSHVNSEQKCNSSSSHPAMHDQFPVGSGWCAHSMFLSAENY